jgi:hypothetical protein
MNNDDDNFTDELIKVFLDIKNKWDNLYHNKDISTFPYATYAAYMIEKQKVAYCCYDIFLEVAKRKINREDLGYLWDWASYSKERQEEIFNEAIKLAKLWAFS